MELVHIMDDRQGVAVAITQSLHLRYITLISRNGCTIRFSTELKLPNSPRRANICHSTFTWKLVVLN